MIITRTLTDTIKTPMELARWIKNQSFEGIPLGLATNQDVPANEYHGMLYRSKSIIADFIPMGHVDGPRNEFLPLGFEPIPGKPRLSLLSLGTAIPLSFEVWGPLHEGQAILLKRAS